MSIPVPTSEHRYLRWSFYLLALIALVVYCLIQAKAILVPLVFAGLIAMLLQWPVDKLSSIMPRGVSIGIIVGLLAVLVLGTFALAGQQIADFASDLPTVKQKAAELLEQGQSFVAETIGIGEQRVEDRVQDQLTNATDNASQTARNFAGTFTTFLSDLFLFFVYLVLVLATENRLREFIIRRAPRGKEQQAADTLKSIHDVAGKYIKGRGILILILFGVYVLGFWWAGLSFALVVAAIAALMSLIPYIGNMIAAGLVLVLAALSDDFANTALIGLGTMAVAQVLESYILTPLIVGDEVSLNALATILAVVVFGTIWGLPGAVLAIPLVAILRQVLLAVPDGKDWAYLLSSGDVDDE